MSLSNHLSYFLCNWVNRWSIIEAHRVKKKALELNEELHKQMEEHYNSYGMKQTKDSHKMLVRKYIDYLNDLSIPDLNHMIKNNSIILDESTLLSMLNKYGKDKAHKKHQERNTKYINV